MVKNITLEFELGFNKYSVTCGTIFRCSITNDYLNKLRKRCITQCKNEINYDQLSVEDQKHAIYIINKSYQIVLARYAHFITSDFQLENSGCKTYLDVRNYKLTDEQFNMVKASAHALVYDLKLDPNEKVKSLYDCFLFDNTVEYLEVYARLIEYYVAIKLRKYVRAITIRYNTTQGLQHVNIIITSL